MIPKLSTIAAWIVGLIAYTMVVGPLRNIFDDRWPYINVFLTTPGRAVSVIAIATGWFHSIKRYHESLVYRRTAIGFSLLLISRLMDSLYVAWAIQNRTELQKWIFDVPSRLFIWKWYFFVDVPNLVAAVGLVFLVLGLVARPSEPTAA